MDDSISLLSASERVSGFYNTIGWVTKDNVTEDAKRFEDLRQFSSEYNSRTRMRVMNHIPASGDHMIDMASGPIQYKEYETYSKNFKKRYCIDFSLDALNMARAKIGSHGEFLHGNFLRLPFDDNYFDCAISLHTIYHIDKDEQEEAVRKLLRITQPGRPVIIVYSNPATLWRKSPLKYLRKRKYSTVGSRKDTAPKLYFYQHPYSWWNRFGGVAEMKIYPWRSFGPVAMKRLFPNNIIGKYLLRGLYFLESLFPKFFSRNFEYYMVVLKKKI